MLFPLLLIWTSILMFEKKEKVFPLRIGVLFPDSKFGLLPDSIFGLLPERISGLLPDRTSALFPDKTSGLLPESSAALFLESSSASLPENRSTATSSARPSSVPRSFSFSAVAAVFCNAGLPIAGVGAGVDVFGTTPGLLEFGKWRLGLI